MIFVEVELCGSCGGCHKAVELCFDETTKICSYQCPITGVVIPLIGAELVEAAP